MKFASYFGPQGPSFGLVRGEEIVDLSTRLSLPDLQALIAQGLSAATDFANRPADFAIAQVRFLPVMTAPRKIICVGVNYDEHRSEMGRQRAEYPTIFTRFADTQIGHLQPLIRPHASAALDYEGELAVIIGRGGRTIPAARALDAIAGYSCYNDASVRDWQRHTSQFIPGKNFPGTGAFGPYLVTADEVGDPQTLQLTTRLNGEVMQKATTDLMIFPVRELIAYISSFTPLLPGDVIITGTPSGVGAARNPPVFMKAGDVVEVEISRVGLLRNPVIDELKLS